MHPNAFILIKEYIHVHVGLLIFLLKIYLWFWMHVLFGPKFWSKLQVNWFIAKIWFLFSENIFTLMLNPNYFELNNWPKGMALGGIHKQVIVEGLYKSSVSEKQWKWNGLFHWKLTCSLWMSHNETGYFAFRQNCIQIHVCTLCLTIYMNVTH